MLMTALIPPLLKFRAICHPFFKAICHRPPMTCAFMCRRIRPPSRPGSWSVRAHDAVVDKRPLGGRAGAGPRTLSDLAPFLWKKGFPWLGWLATRASSCAPPDAGSTGTGARGWPGWLARGVAIRIRRISPPPCGRPSRAWLCRGHTALRQPSIAKPSPSLSGSGSPRRATVSSTP